MGEGGGDVVEDGGVEIGKVGGALEERRGEG